MCKLPQPETRNDWPASLQVSPTSLQENERPVQPESWQDPALKPSHVIALKAHAFKGAW